MNRAVLIVGGVVLAGAAAFGVRMAMQSGATTALETALAHLPPGFAATHGAVAYDALTGRAKIAGLTIKHDGKTLVTVAETDVSGIGAADATGTPVHIDRVVLHDLATGNYRVARIDLWGLAPATLRQVLDTAAYPGGHPAWTDKRPVLDRVELHDFFGHQTQPAHDKVPATDLTFNIGTSGVNGIRLSQLAAPPNYQASVATISATFQMAMSQQSSHLERMNIALTAPQKITVSVASGEGGRTDGGRYDFTKLSGIAIRGDKPGSFTIAALAFRDVDGSRLLPLLPAIQADPGKPHPEVLSDMHIGGIELQRIRVDAPNAPLIALDRVDYAAGTGIAPSMFAIQKLNIQTTNRKLNPNARAQLEAFGMADFTADLNEASTLDAGRLTLSKLDLDLHDLAQLHLTAQLNNVPDFLADPQKAKLAALNMAFAGGSFLWTDHSLFGRLLKLAAFQQHTTPEKLQAVLFVSLLSLHALVPDQQDAADQVGTFLQKQHNLAITLHPPAPITLLQWQSTPAPLRPSLLGVHVTGN